MKKPIALYQIFAVSVFSLTTASPALAAKNQIAANVFSCAEVLMQSPVNFMDPSNPFPITALPLEGDIEAIVLPGSRAIEKGRASAGIFVLTKNSINCHPLPQANVDHGMGTDWTNYDIVLDYGKAEIASEKLSYKFSIGKDSETGKMDTKVSKLEKGGKSLKAHACLDPSSREHTKIVETLRSIAKTFSAQVTKRATAETKSQTEFTNFVDLNIKAIKRCHALNDPQLDTVVDKEIAALSAAINRQQTQTPARTQAATSTKAVR